LGKRTRPTAWHDRKHDHWLAQAAFGLCLGAFVGWLVLLYRGYSVDF
jgi:hypothetical protein